MKSIAKLSLLLALVVTGRLLRPATSTTAATAATTTIVAAGADALRFTFLTGTQSPQAVPVNRRTDQHKEQSTAEPVVWF